MFTRRVRLLLLAVVVVALCHSLMPASAWAQWYLDAAIGANRNLDGTVSIRQPASNLALDFHDVHFEA
jgi:hypothetical protein